MAYLLYCSITSYSETSCIFEALKRERGKEGIKNEQQWESEKE